MQKGILIFFNLFILFTSLATAAEDSRIFEAKMEHFQKKASLFKSIDDAIVINLRSDGKFDIFCQGGEQEIATALDLKLDNICPIQTNATMNILSVHIRADGNFNIVCKDLTQLIATKEEIMRGGLCQTAIVNIRIKAGIYLPKSNDSFFCDSYTVSQTSFDNAGNIESFNLSCDSDDHWDFTCSQDFCTDNTATREVKITAGTENSFDYKSKGYETILELN